MKMIDWFADDLMGNIFVVLKIFPFSIQAISSPFEISITFTFLILNFTFTIDKEHRF